MLLKATRMALVVSQHWTYSYFTRDMSSFTPIALPKLTEYEDGVAPMLADGMPLGAGDCGVGLALELDGVADALPDVDDEGCSAARRPPLAGFLSAGSASESGLVRFDCCFFVGDISACCVPFDVSFLLASAARRSATTLGCWHKWPMLVPTSSGSLSTISPSRSISPHSFTPSDLKRSKTTQMAVYQGRSRHTQERGAAEASVIYTSGALNQASATNGREGQCGA